MKSKALIYMDISNGAEKLYDKQHISEKQYQKVTEYYRRAHEKTCIQCHELNMDSSHVVENMLRIYTLAIQKKKLKELFQHDEIGESIYKKNLNILETQMERVEQDYEKLSSLNLYLSNWGRLLNNMFRRIFFCRQRKMIRKNFIFIITLNTYSYPKFWTSCII